MKKNTHTIQERKQLSVTFDSERNVYITQYTNEKENLLRQYKIDNFLFMILSFSLSMCVFLCVILFAFCTCVCVCFAHTHPLSIVSKKRNKFFIVIDVVVVVVFRCVFKWIYTHTCYA